MKKIKVLFLLILTIQFASCSKKDEAPSRVLTLSCGSNGLEFELCKSAALEWGKKSNFEIKFTTTPNDSNERLALYQQFLASKSSDVDVYQIDVVWPGILAKHFVDLKSHLEAQSLGEHFPAAIANNTIDGRLVALPWFMDAGLLFYRKDLLEKHGEKVPSTWDELEKTALKIMAAEKKANPKSELWGYVFQGRSYEGLACNALEWISSFGGGTVVDPEGKITINNPQSAAAVKLFSSWIGKIVPKGALNYAEEEARIAFQGGQSVFMRNWPYAWGLAQNDPNMKDKVGVAPLPSGPNGKSAATLGGWGLAVSQYSKNAKAAAELVAYLTSEAVQKDRFLKGAFNPTRPSLYEDPALLASHPNLSLFKTAFMGAVSRPSQKTGLKYNEVSNAFWTAVHNSLSNPAQSEANVQGFEKILQGLSNSGQW